MIAAPAVERPAAEKPSNPHAGAAAASTPVPVLGPKAINVERPGAVKDDLDQAADLFKVVFKGEIIP